MNEWIQRISAKTEDWHFNERNKRALKGMLGNNMIKRLEQGKEIDLYSHLIFVIFGQTQSLKLKYTT